MGSRPIILLLFFSALLFLCGMAGFENAEELLTLKDQSQNEAAKEKELAAQEENFQKLKLALIVGQVRTGASSRDIVARFGKPAFEYQGSNGWKRVYSSRQGKLKAPRFYLYFDAKERLARWESVHMETEP